MQTVMRVVRVMIVLSLVVTDAAHAATHCTSAEAVAFSCSVGASKVVSLCLSKPARGGPAQLSYRFGRPGAPELVFPSSSADSLQRFRYAHYFRYQVDRTEVTFSNDRADYAVFDYDEGEERPGSSRGVRVAIDGKDRELRCRGPVVSRLQPLESLLPCDADNALSSCR